jgi:hypothetical protein
MYVFEEDDNSIQDGREHSSYYPPMPKRRTTAGYDVSYYDQPTQQHPPSVFVKPVTRRVFPIKAYFILGMCIMVCLYILGSIVVMPWFHGIQNHWMYGDALISTVSGNVGHGGQSMFVSFEGTGNQIIVIEIVDNKFHVYNGAVIQGSNQRVVVTIELSDVNGDGKLDAIVHVQGEQGTTVLINTGTDYKWSN